MNSLTFLRSGTCTTCQDQGRHGYAFYAVSRGGPLDRTSANIANFLVGNSIDEPLLEFGFLPPTIRFSNEAHIALTGCDMHWQIDGKSVCRYQTLQVGAGAILSGRPSRHGVWSYVAIAGKMNVTRTLESASVYRPARFGANSGNHFNDGQTLTWREQTVDNFIELSIPRSHFGQTHVIANPGPEFEMLDSALQRALYSNAFSISAQSDRMGARLEGNALTHNIRLGQSVPVLPGMVQLIPSGHLIVARQDCQTTGGYPRVLVLTGDQLDKMNQIYPHRRFQFCT